MIVKSEICTRKSLGKETKHLLTVARILIKKGQKFFAYFATSTIFCLFAVTLSASRNQIIKREVVLKIKDLRFETKACCSKCTFMSKFDM